MADNTITVIGNITRDPELRFTPGGQPRAEFGLACNRVWTDRQTNERREQTSFFSIVCWGSLGENAAASLSKGARVIVTGRLEQRSYETTQGEKRERIEIVADEVGPSLRWATVQVEKNDRRGGDFGGGSSSGPRSQGSPVHTPDYDTGEEPF
jgi:single-strand DNA-binding protein